MMARMKFVGRRVLVIAIVGLTLTLPSCASLPETSTPEAIGTIGQQPTEPVAPPPAAGAEPSLLLRKFFEASTDPSNRHGTAREYLTADRARTWQDGDSTIIVDKMDFLEEPRSGDEASYTIRATKVAQLASGGTYEPLDGVFEGKARFQRVDGQWRISEIPDGVMMERGLFVKNYHDVALYYLDPAGTKTVPDPRWIAARQDQVADHLLGLLLAGPSPSLGPAVRSQFNDKISMIGPVTKADGRSTSVGVGPGGIRVDFRGLAGMDAKDRKLLAGQVIWTLQNADISGPYVLLADGEALDEQFASGWTTSDVADLNPLANALNDVGLHAIRDGGLVAVKDGILTPASGYFGGVRNVRSVSLSGDGTLVAAVVDTGRQAPDPTSALMVGTYDGTAFPVAEGGVITRPTWAPDDGSAWAVIDGVRVTRAVRDTSLVSVVDVDATAVSSIGRISELRLSRDGVRVALIIDGKVYIATVVQGPAGYAITNPRAVPTGPGTAISLDWSTSENVVVALDASEIPVVMVSIDGSRLEMLPNRNLTGPVTVVDATTTSEYVADARAVFQLTNTDAEADRNWREVPGLSGLNAIPVLPG